MIYAADSLDRRSARANTQGTRFSVVIAHAFWVVIFVAFPLALNPGAMGAIDNPSRFILEPKALVLTVAWCLGLFAAMLAYPQSRLLTSPAAFARLPTAIQLVAGAGAFVLARSVFGYGTSAAPIALIGSPIRFDGGLLQFAWLTLAAPAYALAFSRIVGPSSVLRYFVVGALITGAWATAQAYGFEPLGLLEPALVSQSIPAGPLGHRALVAGYLAMSLAGLSAYLTMRKEPIGVAGFAGTALLAGFLLASEGRSGMAAFLVVMAVVAVYGIKFPATRRKLSRLGLVVVLAWAVVGISKPDGMGAGQFTTLVSASQGDDSSFSMRTDYYWPLALEAIATKPFFGWGIDGFGRAFWQFATAEQERAVVGAHIGGRYAEVHTTGSAIVMVRSDGQDELRATTFHVDKAHNLYLDLALAMGLPFLVVLLTAGSLALARVVRFPDEWTCAMFVAFGVYSVFGLAWFETLQVSPVAWTLFGSALGFQSFRPVNR